MPSRRPFDCVCNASADASAWDVSCKPSSLCRGSTASPTTWTGVGCILTSVYATKAGLRPWHDGNLTKGLHSEVVKLEQLLQSLDRVGGTRMRVLTMVHPGHEWALRGLSTTPWPLRHRSHHPWWASAWHRLTFVKLSAPRVGAEAGCDKVLFLDNDACTETIRPRVPAVGARARMGLADEPWPRADSKLRCHASRHRRVVCRRAGELHARTILPPYDHAP